MHPTASAGVLEKQIAMEGDSGQVEFFKGGSKHGDDIAASFGASSDGTIKWNASFGELVIEVPGNNDDFVVKLGSSNGAAKFAIRDSGGIHVFRVSDRGIPIIGDVTSTVEDTLTDKGSILSNFDLDALRYRGAAGWNYASKPNENIVFVRQASDFPAAVANIRTLLASTVYFVEGAIDIGADMIVGGTSSRIHGIDSIMSSITSTHATATAQDIFLIDKMTLLNTGSGVSLDITANKAAFAFRSQFLNSVNLTDTRAILWQSVAITGGTLTFNGSINAFISTGMVAINLSSAIDAIVFADGATCNDFCLNSGVFNAGVAGGRSIVVSDPDAIVQGLINGTNFVGVGSALTVEPVVDNNFDTGFAGLRGCAIDDDGNLMVSDVTTQKIHRYIDLTSVTNGTVDVSATALSGSSGNVFDLAWRSEGLIIVSKNASLVYGFVGFTDADAFTPWSTPGTNARGVTWDGRNIITSDATFGLIYIHDTTTGTVLKSFTPLRVGGGAFSLVTELAFDGRNLLICDNTGDVIVVMDGIGPNALYEFTAPADQPTGIAVSEGNAVITDTGASGERAYIYTNNIIFDQGSNNWQFQNTIGLKDSTDGACSNAEVSVAANVVVSTINDWIDIALSGTLFYNILNPAEKFTLNDVNNGELIYNGIRSKSFAVSGSLNGEGTGGSDDNIEIGISVNGSDPGLNPCTIQSGIVRNNQRISITIPTSAVRLVTGDTIKLQVRNTSTANDIKVFQSKMTIVSA